MGVPTFYRWLVTRYPKIVKNVYEYMDAEEYLRRKKIDEVGDAFMVPDLKDYVNNTDNLHCSDNINGYYDNLYLDMNGIIHCCSHPQDKQAPACNGEIFLHLFYYIDRLFDIIEPKKLLFMAIDGVAPKAKMNQQRSRRFKSILDSEIEKKLYLELKETFLAKNKKVPDPPEHWDSNVITPGTEFMHELSNALKYFIEYKITHDNRWKEIIVIFSDSNVCGEGEHKIYNFIKSQRSQPTYDPNTRHVIHGMDADLIMLSLASHEPYFYVLREVVILDPKADKHKKEFIGVLNHKSNTEYCISIENPIKEYNKYKDPKYANIRKNDYVVPFHENWMELQILDLTVLREYLSKDLFPDVRYDFERCIDDFIFICFFCGNDFLPHLPSISIVSGSIDQLILLYQKVLPLLGDYLTCEGTLNMKQVVQYLSYIAEIEREIFISQKEFKKRREQRELEESTVKNVKMEEEATEKEYSKEQLAIADEEPYTKSESGKVEDSEYGRGLLLEKKLLEAKLESMQPSRNVRYKDKKGERMINFIVRPITTSANAELTNQEMELQPKETVEPVEELHREPSQGTNKEPNGLVEFEFDVDDEEEEETETDIEKKLRRKENEDFAEFYSILKENIRKAKESDNPADVDLGADDDPEAIRINYYRIKFHLDEEDDVETFIKNVVFKYMEGLSWVLLYYFQSCPMWHWYYPYYYAPLASDLLLDNISFHFEKDEPLLPFEQLLSVLPASSCHCLPKIYRPLMLNEDSPIIDFYPTTFKEEENGKKYKHQWIVLLPFVDKDRLLKHVTPLHAYLTEEEKKRNRRGHNKIYADQSHLFSKQIRKVIKKYLKIERKQLALQNTNENEKEELNKKEMMMIEKSTQENEVKPVYAKVEIKPIKDVNIFGTLLYEEEESAAKILKKIFTFSNSFTSTCCSSYYIQPELIKHSSTLLPNLIQPKKVLNLLDINNTERKLRFNAAAAKRMILNSLRNNHPHIYLGSKNTFTNQSDMNPNYPDSRKFEGGYNYYNTHQHPQQNYDDLSKYNYTIRNHLYNQQTNQINNTYMNNKYQNNYNSYAYCNQPNQNYQSRRGGRAEGEEEVHAFRGSNRNAYRGTPTRFPHQNRNHYDLSHYQNFKTEGERTPYRGAEGHSGRYNNSTKINANFKVNPRHYNNERSYPGNAQMNNTEYNNTFRPRPHGIPNKPPNNNPMHRPTGDDRHSVKPPHKPYANYPNGYTKPYNKGEEPYSGPSYQNKNKQ